MKKAKKILIAAFALVVAVSLAAGLSACDTKGDSTSDKTISKEIDTADFLKFGTPKAKGASGYVVDGYYAYRGPNKFTKAIIPEIHDKQAVTGIAKEAFLGCKTLEELSVPKTVLAIEDGAFAECRNLKTARLQYVPVVGAYAFINCAKLESIELPYVSIIEASTFEGCRSLKDLSIPCSVEDISEKAFAGCSGLSALKLESGIAHIGESAFEGCALEGLELPLTIMSIGSRAFADCSALKTVRYPGTMDQFQGLDFYEMVEPVHPGKPGGKPGGGSSNLVRQSVTFREVFAKGTIISCSDGDLTA